MTNVSGTLVAKDYYGPGGVFFWMGTGARDLDEEIGAIAYYVMNWKAENAQIDCICYAAAMTSVKVPATDFYYRQ